MYMCGYTDEDEFDEHMKTHHHLPDTAKNLKVPHLLVAGDMDELCTPDDIAHFRENLAGSSELWLYEGVFHPMGEVSAEIYPAMADWMQTTLKRAARTVNARPSISKKVRRSANTITASLTNLGKE